MIGDKDDQHRVLPWVALFIIVVLLGVGILFIILMFMNKPSPVVSSSSEEASSTSEVLSSSVYDDYIDVTVDNMKKYISEVGSETLSTTWTVNHIYSVNTYVDGSNTVLVYGFTVKEEENKYIRIEIDLEKELSDIEEVVSLIHDDSISIDMFVGHELYEVIEDDLINKDSFKELYKGDYTYGLTYKSDSETYHYSGIGVDTDRFVSIDYLKYDKTTYDIDNTDSHVEITSTGRYYQLLAALL